ncbi:MAG: hypothetical protein M3478_12755, partial [Planctomycetota bacterium]|nr:hypothetical protein [Planctomycetota bacterium]
GTQMILRPNPSRTFDPETGFPLNAGALSVTRYGIRSRPRTGGGGGGGSVLVNLASTAGVTVIAGGQQETRGTAEIGEINANGLGTLIVEDPGTRLNTSEDDELELDRNADGTLEELEVILNGSAAIDVFEIAGGNFTEIINGTAGEIVNVNALSIGEIEAATLGLSKSRTGTLVGGNTILNTTPTQVDAIADAGPFNGQRIGIVVAGDIVSARARQGLGNFIVDGSIQELHANSDGRNTKGVHEGINAPVMTRTGGVAEAGGGEIRWIQIGEGILHSGTGSVSFSGIFAHSRIGTIVNQGEGSDIRGDVHSKAENLPTFQRLLNDFTFEIVPLEAIGAIDLDDGAIINSDIQVTTRFQNSFEIGGGPIVSPDSGSFSGQPVNEIGIISLEGKGGIMSSLIAATDVGDIEVKDGFGIFNSSIESNAQGGTGNITVDGYGVRSTSFLGGGDLASINARGSGIRLNAMNYTSSVRYSERERFDPFTGYVLSEVNDLHFYLGTSSAAPIRLVGDYGRGGIIDDVDARGSGTLGSVSAHQIKSSFFTYASATDSIVARDYIDTLFITSGRLNFLQSRQDVYNANWRIAGPVGSIRIGGTWRGTSLLAAEGPNGQIHSFSTGRALYGTLISTNNIDEVLVGTDVGAVGSFNFEGERVSAGIDVGGDFLSFRVGGSVLDGSTVFVGDLLGLLAVDGDIQEESRIDTKRFGTLKLGGSLNGDLVIRDET